MSLEEKERKSEADVDGQRQAQRDREAIIGRICARMGCLKATSPKHHMLTNNLNKKPISY